ncbi:BglG family transcription antiterminator [Cohnella hongkongensis]|uniref:BglG family transcription antiterminator n=1 Tax=Cohnella hongkongensis TaxID=178337 RepID=A0ABV9FHZ7_9BACL
MGHTMKIKLNARQQQILLYFLESGDYAPLSALAERLNVSLRTLQRELSELELYLGQHGLGFDKKIGAGVRLCGQEAKLEELAGRLVRDETMLPAYSAEERQANIKLLLLTAKEPKKLYALSKPLNVAESTISNDLQKVEPWFEKYGIRLYRRPGLGVYVEGAEKSIRAAMADLLYEQVTQEQLVEFLHEPTEERREKLHASIRLRLLNFIDPEWLFRIEEVIQRFEQSRGYRMADNAYVGFVVHLALAVQRLKANEAITIEDEILTRLKSTKEFELARELAAGLSRLLELTIPESEIGYITMHILGARSNHVMGSDFDYSVVLDDVRRMISVMEQELRLELESDETLVHNLTTHLTSAVKRIELDMAVRNPLLQHVKEEYPDIFEAARKASGCLEQRLGKSVPEEEIGYLAMHFGTAILNKQEAESSKIRVLLVCSSGIGTSRLLQAQLKKKLPELQVVDTISLFHLEAWLAEHAPVDLVLSTMPVRLEGVRAVVVNPFLTDEEIEGLRKQLPLLARAERSGEQERSSVEQVVDQVDRYGRALAGLLDHIEAADRFPAGSKSELIGNLMAFVQERFDVSDVAALRRDLERREELGPLLMEEDRLAILHCRSEGIREMSVSVLRLAGDVRWELGGRSVPVRTVLAMLGPADAPKENFELVSEISMSLVEDDSFIRTLASGTAGEVLESIRYILKKGYVKLAGQLLR